MWPLCHSRKDYCFCDLQNKVWYNIGKLWTLHDGYISMSSRSGNGNRKIAAIPVNWASSDFTQKKIVAINFHVDMPLVVYKETVTLGCKAALTFAGNMHGRKNMYCAPGVLH